MTEMLVYVPYIVLAAGINLLVLAAMVNASGILNRVVFRIVPALIGGASLFAAAMLFVAGS